MTEPIRWDRSDGRPELALITNHGYAGVEIPVGGAADTGGQNFYVNSLSLALERLEDPAAATPLATLLQKPGMRGHARTSLRERGKPGVREPALREITLARALYRCGDHEGLGKAVLEAYRGDVRGLFARHAQSVLKRR